MQEFEEYCNLFQDYMTAKIELQLKRDKYEGYDFGWHYHSEINEVNRLRMEAEEAFISLVKVAMNNLSSNTF